MDINNSAHLLISLIRIMDTNNSLLQITNKDNNDCSLCKARILDFLLGYSRQVSDLGIE